jgi:hypothetical protein
LHLTYRCVYLWLNFLLNAEMRLRIVFSKTGSLRYTGHLDLQTVWERTVRRAGLPLAYTHGFHPGPKIQIASALPLGFIGRCEIVDIWLQESSAPGGVLAAGLADVPPSAQGSLPAAELPAPAFWGLQPAAPPGLTILSVEQVDEGAPALQTQVASAEYEVTLLEPVSIPDLEQRLQDLLAAASLPRQRRGRDYDLRPLVEELFLLPLPPFSEVAQQPRGEMGGGTQGGLVRVHMRLAARQGATGRPEEVLDLLGISFETTRIARTRLILKSGIE